MSVFTSRLLATDLNKHFKSLWSLLPVSCSVTQSSSVLICTQVLLASTSLLQLTTARKRPLFFPTKLRHGPTENTSRGLFLSLSLHFCVTSRPTQKCVHRAVAKNGLHNPAVLLLRAHIAGCLSSRCLTMRWYVTIYFISYMMFCV
jgi:hypothetical protein